MSTVAVAATTAAITAAPAGVLMLGPHDIVGATFYIACNMMLAFTAFFFMQVPLVPKKWATSVSVSGLVTGIAWYNYTFMRDIWVTEQSTPTTYRYTDWLITVPLLVLEFFLILRASGPCPVSVGTKLFVASLLMLLFGWLAEIEVTDKVSGFSCAMFAWIFIIYEIYLGEVSGYVEHIGNDAAKGAFKMLRTIVFIGWSIYPIGFVFGYFIPMEPAKEQAAVNIIYNLADLINKGAFGVVVWGAAMSDKEN